MISSFLSLFVDDGLDFFYVGFGLVDIRLNVLLCQVQEIVIIPV
jgi:hypothetical protein